MITQEKLIEFADHILELEDAKKEATKIVNEAYDDFCSENEGLKKKELKKAVKEYSKWLADKENFLQGYNEFELLLDLLTKELDGATVEE